VSGAATFELLEEFKILAKEHDTFYFTTHEPIYLNKREYDARFTRYRFQGKPALSVLTVSQYIIKHDRIGTNIALHLIMNRKVRL